MVVPRSTCGSRIAHAVFQIAPENLLRTVGQDRRRGVKHAHHGEDRVNIPGPHGADGAKAEDFLRIREIVSSNEKIVAVGECGLDYDRMFSTRENQIRCFEHHLKIAEELGKPLFLHEREAAEDFIARFKKHGDLCRHSVVHCFTGSKETLMKYLDMGFYIGITGWICDERRGDALREAVKYIPLERLMIETDAPYLTPRNIKGLDRTNVPQNIKYVAAELARNMGVEEEELIMAVKENTEQFFGI